MFLFSTFFWSLNNLFFQISINNPNYIEIIGFQAWVQGILFILFLYHFLFFFQNKNRMFLYYSAYMFCLIVYFGYYNPEMFYMPDNGIYLSISFFYVIQFLAYFFYLCYLREVLNTKSLVPKWDKILEIAKKVVLVFSLLLCISSYLLSVSENFVIATLFFCLLTLFAVINYFIFYRIKGMLVKLLILGSLVYVVLANLSLLYSIRMILSDFTPKYNPIIFMEIGAIIEGLIFALVVGYKFNEIERKKKLTQIQLLEKSVEASELKITALKAQMNPHFIFNVLNSINSFILKNEKEKASDYLTKFAKLIRTTLKHSSQSTISLKDELDTIYTYVKLEKLRVYEGFDLVINNFQGLNLDLIKIPPLSLQPYIENAIWHGLYSKKGGDKKIEINISSKQNNDLIITIKDNGVGRLASAKLRLEVRKSFGTKITKERIKMVHPNSTIQIEDVCSDSNPDIVLGTMVIITMKDALKPLNFT